MRITGLTGAAYNKRLDKLAGRYRRKIAAEIARSMRHRMADFAATGRLREDPDHARRISTIYSEMAIASVRPFAGRILQDVSRLRKSAPDLETKGFAQTMAKIALRYITLEAVRRRIVRVTETTRARIIDMVDSGYRDGLGQREVAKRIFDAVPEIARTRANVIARTETHGAANYGATAAARETGLPMMREWLSAEDHRTRQSHVDADGQKVGADEHFTVGDESLMHPGDPNGSPEEVINCRCSVAFIIDESRLFD